MVKELPNCYVDILDMIWNYRIVRSDKNRTGYDRAWCFFGKSYLDLARTAAAAAVWDGGDETAPIGWDKNAMTGEISDDGRRRLEQ